MRPFYLPGVMTVPVRITARFNADDAMRELFKNAHGWAKTMEYATRDMRRNGGSIIAKHTSGTFNIRRPKVNPTSRQFKGHCSVAGGLAEMEWTYAGGMQTPVDFGMTPTGRQRGRYTTMASIKRGSSVKVGHGGPPWSEGGRHSRRNSSPAFFIPGIKPPLYRDASGKFTAVKVTSVPYMVTNEDHIGKTMEELQQEHYKIVTKRLGMLL